MQLNNRDHVEHYDLDGVSMASTSSEANRIRPEMKMSHGMTESNRKQIAAGLSSLLADSSMLYLKTQNYHWNVTGPNFQPLHLLFMGQYQDLALAIDLMAERIRSLGFPTPGTYSEYRQLTQITEHEGVLGPEQMLEALWKDQEIIIETARKTVALANLSNDLPTLDLLTQRMQAHEKNSWMLRSSMTTTKTK